MGLPYIAPPCIIGRTSTERKEHMNFDSFDLHPQIVAGVQALGYSTPTPIQRQAIPPVLKGQDVLGLAQTGTGKTAAFALPILQWVLQRTEQPFCRTG